MAVTNQYNRTKSMIAEYMLGIDNIGASNAVTMAIPRGATVVRIVALTITAFNPGGTGTATLSVGDGTTTFVNAQDVESTGSETVANTPKHYADGGTITSYVTQVVDTTAATAGKVHLVVEYVQTGASCGIQE